MSQACRVDRASLKLHLSERLGRRIDSIRLVRLQDNYLFKVGISGVPIALKLHPCERTDESRIVMHARILKDLHKFLPSARLWTRSGLRQPFVLEAGESRFFALALEWLDGRQIRATTAGAYIKMARLLASLHRARICRGLHHPCSIRGLLESGDLIDTLHAIAYCLPPEHRLRLDLIALKLIDIEPVECIAHGDPVPSNFLSLADGRTALIDFDLSGVGSPEDDLGVIWSDLLFRRQHRLFWPPFITAYRGTSRRDIDVERIRLSALRHAISIVRWYQAHPSFDRVATTRAVAVAKALIEPLLDL